MTASLAERLRNETRGLHTEVERSTLMHALLRGELSLLLYCMLLRNLHAIYLALEAALVHHAQQPLLAPIFASALFRTDALEQDLNTLYGPFWDQAIALQPTSRLYVDRLRELDQTRSVLLVAHSSVRYLGDLSGGQILKRIVAKSFLAVRQRRHGVLRLWRFGSGARVDARISRWSGQHRRTRRPDRRYRDRGATGLRIASRPVRATGTGRWHGRAVRRSRRAQAAEIRVQPCGALRG